MLCPFCKQLLPDGSAFCGYCGKKLIGAADANAEVSVAEVVETAADKAEEAAAEVVETAADKAEEPVAEAVETAADKAEEAVAEVVETAADKAEEAVAEAVETAADKAEEAAAEVVETAADKTEEAAAGTVGFVADKAETAAETDEVAAEVVSEGDGKAKTIDFSALLKNKKLLICCAAACVVVILLIVICANVVSALANSNPIKGSYYEISGSGETYFLYNGKKVSGEFSGLANLSAVSEDGTCALVVDDDTLYYLVKGRATEICDELDSTRVSLSRNGKTAVYVADDEIRVYSGGREKKIYEPDSTNRLVYTVSPDGKTVAFSEYDDGLYRAYAWNGSKVIDLGAKFRAMYISNGGKIIYGLDSSDRLVYLKNLKSGSDVKMRSYSATIAMSSDYSKILFYDSSAGNTYYFDSSLKEEIKVSGDAFGILTANSSILPDSFDRFYGGNGNSVYLFYRKGKEYNKDRILSRIDSVSISADRKTLVYIDDDELMKAPVSNTDKDRKLAGEVYSYQADHALKYIYYRDDDGDLRYAAGKNNRVCADVRDYFVNDKGVCVFRDTDSDLYYSVRGGEKKKIMSDADSLSCRNGIFYAVSDDELYVSTDGKKFIKTGIEL